MTVFFKPKLFAGLVSLGAIAAVSAWHPAVSDSTSLTEPGSDLPAEQTRTAGPTSFFVVAGGGAPSYNEIALEKNVRYFQRTLEQMEYSAAEATVLFANGNDGRATIRYIDPMGREQFKVPEIDHLAGPATMTNVRDRLSRYPQTTSAADNCPMFMYFTGHGALNSENDDNNAMILWEEEYLSVQALASLLDQWPPEIPFVTMMAQCYSGSFANMIYEQGDPSQPVALQSRCGFFATVKTRPSVGCTPLVNEADYRDYSSSFFAGLSGRDRLGHAAPSADYDGDGQVSFTEAHAFTKVDAMTPDWPISTSEAWLQRRASEADKQRILAMPMESWMQVARPEQRHVISTLANKLGYPLSDSFESSPVPKARFFSDPQEVLTAYYMRLQMTLLDVGMEQQVRSSRNAEAIATLEQLLTCEAGTW